MNHSDIKYIVVHCSATPPSQDIGFTEIDKWHKQRGWSGCGYHYIIRRNGTIEIGRRLNKAGAHAYGYNRKSWGICLVGGVDTNNHADDNFRVAQYEALEVLLHGLSAFAPDAQILGHRDLSPDIDGDGIIEEWEWKKSCPCFDVQSWWS